MLFVNRNKVLMMIPLVPSVGWNPSAFNMSFTFISSSFTTSPTPHVRTVLFGLVPTVLTSCDA